MHFEAVHSSSLKYYLSPGSLLPLLVSPFTHPPHNFGKAPTTTDSHSTYPPETYRFLPSPFTGGFTSPQLQGNNSGDWFMSIKGYFTTLVYLKSSHYRGCVGHSYPQSEAARRPLNPRCDHTQTVRSASVYPTTKPLRMKHAGTVGIWRCACASSTHRLLNPTPTHSLPPPPSLTLTHQPPATEFGVCFGAVHPQTQSCLKAISVA